MQGYLKTCPDYVYARTSACSTLYPCLSFVQHGETQDCLIARTLSTGTLYLACEKMGQVNMGSWTARTWNKKLNW